MIVPLRSSRPPRPAQSDASGATAPRGRRSVLALGAASTAVSAAQVVLPSTATATTAATATTGGAVALPAARRTRRMTKHRDRCRHCRNRRSTVSHPRCATCGRCHHCARCGHSVAAASPTAPDAPATTSAASPAGVGGLAPLDAVITSRFSYGLTPSLTAEVLAAGGGLAWFTQQVSGAYEVDHVSAIADWWPDLHLGPQELWQRDRDDVRSGMEVANSFVSREMMRRIQSPSQVLEVMTEFWSHHLYVPASGEGYFTWRASYGDLIRKHALGRFDAMLANATVHPAMLVYLNAATSTKKHPNENLGRELLELHTVGIGNYGEDDVKSCARILTGYRVDVGGTWARGYTTDDHWTGPVSVMGFQDPNTDPDGRPMAARLLRYLARHPATARRIALKLATYFVSDEPPADLVDALTRCYLDNRSAIAPMLDLLVRHPAFVASAGGKLRDPAQDVVATHRALGTRISRPTGEDSASLVLRQHASYVGLQPYGWATPDGPPLDATSWATPSRALASMRVHWTLANSHFPSTDIVYRTPAQWLPALPMSVNDVVVELSRRILSVEPPAGLLDTVCWLTLTTPDEVVTEDHSLITRRWSLVLGLMLDHPLRYRR